MPGFLVRGFSAVTEDTQRVEKRLEDPWRVWLKPNTRKKLIFLDGDPAVIREHNPLYAGSESFHNEFTCATGTYDPALCCEALGPRDGYLVGYFTVVDVSPDTKTGQPRYEMRLYPGRKGCLEKLEARAKVGGLAGMLVDVGRGGEKTASVGDDYIVERKVDLAKLMSVVCYHNKPIKQLISMAADLAAKGDASMQERLVKLFSFNMIPKSVASPTPAKAAAPKPDAKADPKAAAGPVQTPAAAPAQQLVWDGLPPTFNWSELLAPKPPEEMKKLLQGARSKWAPKAKRSPSATVDEGSTSEFSATEEVPF
jgi:hypothetical protein